ncbi:MAG: HlyD family efflux transporter periplasmic adaptor subunit [Clostridia bacterium]
MNSEIKTKAINFYKRNKIMIAIFAIAIFVFGGVSIYNKMFKSKTVYTIVNGYVEKVSDTFAYLIKKETKIQLSKTDATVPVIEQGKRASKQEIVSMYKDKNYDDYLKQIEIIDKEIQSIIKDLPIMYSNDINAIDTEIARFTQEATQITSYVKIQEYKHKIDELSYKKIITLGQISPKGSKIRELIEKREKIEEGSKSSNGNIRAPAAGVVTYKIDNLEEVATYDNALDYTEEDFDNIIEKYMKNNINNFGIKIVDNFNVYVLVKEPQGENEQYIKEGKNYLLKITDKEQNTLNGTLVKLKKSEKENYILFKITDGIEQIVDARVLNVEIVWAKVSGMSAPLNSIKKDETLGYNYITIIKGGNYVNVPVEVKITSDSICIIENLSEEKRKEKNINSKEVFLLYDQIVV